MKRATDWLPTIVITLAVAQVQCRQVSAALQGAGAEQPAVSNAPEPGSTTQGTATSFEAYCGLYSLHTAMNALGREIDFAELLRPEYIGSVFGSSMADLMRAATDHGLHVAPMRRMTGVMLRQGTCPVILHVKSQPNVTQYNHWVVYLGTEGPRAKIQDGRTLSLESWEQLVARWNGTGLLISDKPIDRREMTMAAFARFLIYAAIVVLGIGIARQTQFYWSPNLFGVSRRPIRDSIWQALFLTAVALVAPWLFRVLHEEGFLSDEEVVAGIQDFHATTFLPVVRAREVRRVLGTGAVTFVDARWSRDFEAGHLPDAINIPPNSSEAQCTEVMAHVPKDQRVIVYCQIDGCSYSRKVAKKLMAIGYTNLTLFPGGWVEWTERAIATRGGRERNMEFGNKAQANLE